MSPRLIAAAAAVLSVAAIAAAQTRVAPSMAPPGTPRPAIATDLKPLSAFTGIKDRNERSLALFAEVGKVIEHPRCLNCHPAGDRPSQTDRMTPHQPMVVRGDANFGAAGMHCTTCHRAANFDPAGVPGNPAWALAPIEQAWQGKSLGDICRQIKDPARNGGKDMAALIHHMAEDELVGWGWHPGRGRTPVPGTQKQFGDLFKAWAASGASCPA